MAEVVRARVYGFCMGVRRAMETALDEAESAGEGTRVYTLGPLIHNAAAMDLLAERGVSILRENALPRRLDGAVVVIRAHGVPPAIAAEVIARGGRVVDATCPRVRISQKKAAAFSERGFVLFLAGEADHGEVVGIAAFASDCRIVSDAVEARAAACSLKAERPDARTALIGQTTIKKSEYADISAALAGVFPDIEVFDSTCPATMDRQTSLLELCGTTDAIVVVGGKNSANTKRLYASARESGKPAWHVERADELPPELFRFDRIGLTAGASTPEAVIDEVEARLRSGR
jgi:4-hydroxy-3-methylbut-2-enyl diphosphate reductase